MARTQEKLKRVCQDYRRTLLVRETVTLEQMNAEWPGGEKNPDRSLMGWIKAYGTLRVWLAQRSPEALAAERAVKQQQRLDAISDTPETVELSDIDADGNRRTMTVYVKSDIALRAVHNRNLLIAQLLDGTNVLLEHGLTPDDAALVIRANETVGYLQRCIAWILTTPGVGLPFAEAELEPDPPAEYVDLSTPDFYLLALAAQRVNVGRLACLEHSQSSETKPDWPAYWAGAAGAFNTTPPHLQREHSLVSLIVAGAERVRAEKKATERAKAKATSKART